MIAQNVAEIVSRHVTLSVEGINRMYLNVFVPGMQYEPGIVRFFRHHRGMPLPSAALMQPMSRGFVSSLEAFSARNGIALVQFRKGERKDTVMAERLWKVRREEGVVFIGKAQEKTAVFRTEKRRSPSTSALIRGSCGRRRWSITTTFMPLTGLWSVLLEVLQLFSLQCQALPERARVCQAAARQGQHCL